MTIRTHSCRNVTVLKSRNVSITATTTATAIVHEEGFWLFRISFMYYSFIGFLIVIFVGYPVSLFTADDSILDEILLTPFMRSKEYKEKERLGKRFQADYSQIEMKAMVK